MKRVLIALITTLPLAVGVAAAQASTPFPGSAGVMVGGTVVSVTGADSFTANAFIVPTPGKGMGAGMGAGGWPGSSSGGIGLNLGSLGFDPGGFSFFATRHTTTSTSTTTPVTITVNSSTKLEISGVTGTPTISDLVPGARFGAFFPGSASDTIQTLVASAPTSVYAQLPMQFYAFVGSVQSTNTTTGALTVDVTASAPSGLISGGSNATFTVGTHTLIIGGSSLTSGNFGGLFGGSLTNVSKGDIVAGGLIGPAGQTATQVEASSLMFLLDLPAPTTSVTSGVTSDAERKALKETLTVLHGGKVKVKARTSHAKQSHKKSRRVGKS
jgi:hypothetical protein